MFLEPQLWLPFDFKHEKLKFCGILLLSMLLCVDSVENEFIRLSRCSPSTKLFSSSGIFSSIMFAVLGISVVSN